MVFKRIIKWKIKFLINTLAKFRKKRGIPENPKSILVLLFGFIGDVAMTTPALHALHKKFPNAKIDVVVGSWSQEVLKNNKDKSRVIVFDNPVFNRTGRTSIKALFYFLKEIRKKEYDITICFRGELGTLIFSYLSKAKFRVGYNHLGTGKLLDLYLQEPYNIELEKKHEVKRCLDLVKLLGCDTKDESLIMELSQNEKRFAENFFRKEGIRRGEIVIGLYPGATWKMKTWPKEYFIELIHLIKANNRLKNSRILLFGIQRDRERLIYINERTGGNSIIIDNVSLRQFTALSQRCDCFVGNDTGTTHIAAALTGTIGVFGPGHFERTKLAGKNSISLTRKVKCAPCDYGVKVECPKAGECCLALKRIKPEEVFDCINKLIKRK